jgi:hypothetical protein
MDVGYALLAEYISEDRSGKLNISGIFDEIYAKTAPYKHPRMFAAVQLNAKVSEGSEHLVRLDIVDEDGESVVAKSPPIHMSLYPRGPGMPMRGEIVTEFVGVRFQRFGDYEFRVFLNDTSLPIATVGFSVIAMDHD